MNFFTNRRHVGYSLTPLAALLITASASLTPSIAHADYCGACVAETRNQHRTTRSHVSQKVHQATVDIVQAITKTTQDATAATTRQQTEVAKAQNEAAIERSRAEDKRAVERSMGEVSCDMSSSANGPRGGGVASGGRPASGAGSGYKPSSALDDYTKKALDTAGQTENKVVLPKNTLEQNYNLAMGGCSTFAAPGSERALQCENADIQASGEIAKELPDADIKANSLFDFQRQIVTVSRDGKARDARNVYLMNVSKPFPLPTFNEDTLKSPLGLNYMSLYNQYEAIKSMGEFPLREYDRLTSSLPDDDATGRKALSSAHDEMMKSPATAEFITTYLSEVNSAQVDSKTIKFEDLSPLDVMNIEVERRIGNPKWVEEMAAKTHEEKVSEMMMMQAYDMRIRYAQLKATYQTNVLLGQIINNQADDVYRPRLNDYSKGLDGQRSVQNYNAGETSKQ